ncbi:MAG TPA: M48 family metalloprotease [Candidatus Thermoplasmatota archaeon]
MTAAGSIARTFGLFTLVFAVMFAIAWALAFVLSAWSLSFFLVFAVIAVLINLFTYYASSALVLRGYRCKVVSEQEAPELHKMVAEVAVAAGVPKPKVAIMPSASPNAFATGRNPKHAVVAYTTGILELLNEKELRGVTAHELGHVKNYDTLVMTATATVSAFIAYAIYFAGMSAASRGRGGGFGAMIIAYFAGMLVAALIRTFVSRRREYGADATGSRILGDTTGLQNALLKLDYATKGRPMKQAREASAHLFIVNPLSGRQAGSMVAGLFMSHPPLEKRVARLRDMSE